MRLNLLIPFFVFALLISCKKETTVDRYVEKTVDDNSFDSPEWVTENEIRNFVYRLSLDLVGNQPDTAWIASKTQELKAAGFTKEAKAAVARELVADPGFRHHFYQLTTDRLLDGVGRVGVTATLMEYRAVLAQFEANNQELEAQLFREEVAKMEALLIADSMFLDAGALDFNTYVRPFLFNGIYDNINMGAENFVVACYQHVYGRYPTTYELEQAKLMVDGGNGQLYSQSGNSKTDFLSIFASSPEYLSGNVRWLELVWLRGYLGDDEHWYIVDQYQSNANIEELIVSIVVSAKYEEL